MVFAAKEFFQKFSVYQEDYYQEDLAKLATVSKPEHMKGNQLMENFKYELLPIMKTCPCNMQIIFFSVKINNFIEKKNEIFNIFAQNIVVVPTSIYSLYFGAKIYPIFTDYIQVGFKWVFNTLTCYPDDPF